MEKADILEMTVQFLYHLNQKKQQENMVVHPQLAMTSFTAPRHNLVTPQHRAHALATATHAQLDQQRALAFATHARNSSSYVNVQRDARAYFTQTHKFASPQATSTPLTSPPARTVANTPEAHHAIDIGDSCYASATPNSFEFSPRCENSTSMSVSRDDSSMWRPW